MVRSVSQSTRQQAGNSAPAHRLQTQMSLFHCNFCRRDITHELRVRCFVCANFDLCVTCFGAGAEVGGHKSDHPYQVLDRLDFRLFSTTWTAEEELVLLESIEQHGLGNWTDVAKALGSKTAEECKAHYFRYYLESPTAPLPDTSHLAQQPVQQPNGAPPIVAAILEEEPPPPPPPTPEETSAGYNPLRREFEIDWENEVEVVLRDISFYPDDSEVEREVKHKALEAYQWIVDERVRRREIIIGKGLLEYRKMQLHDRKQFTDKEIKETATMKLKDLCKQLRVFMQVMDRKEYDEFLSGMAMEMAMQQYMDSLRASRAAGVRTYAENQAFLDDKLHREQELSQRKASYYLERPTSQWAPLPGGLPGRPFSKKSKPDIKGAKGPAVRSMPGVWLLSEEETKICEQFQLTPNQYLVVKEGLMRENDIVGGVSRHRAKRIMGTTSSVAEAFLGVFAANGLIVRLPTPPASPSSPASGDRHEKHHKRSHEKSSHKNRHEKSGHRSHKDRDKSSHRHHKSSSPHT